METMLASDARLTAVLTEDALATDAGAEVVSVFVAVLGATEVTAPLVRAFEPIDDVFCMDVSDIDNLPCLQSYRQQDARL